MRRPAIIGLLSIVPGLGLVALGEIRQGVTAFILTLLPFTCLFTQLELVSITGVTIGLIIWITQGYYAVVAAQRLARSQESAAIPVSRVSSATSPAGATYGEKLIHSARQAVMELLEPGETLQVALSGSPDVRPPLANLLDEIFLRQRPSAQETRPLYLGVTEADLILVKTDAFGKPAELQRFPLSQVALVKSSAGWLSDEVVIQVGEPRPLHLAIGRPLRQATRQLVEILASGEAAAGPSGERFQGDRGSAPGEGQPKPPAIPGSGIQSKHPILLAAQLGAGGGLAGVVVASILIAVAGIAWGYTMTSSDSAGLAEALGLLIGIYCLVMFPVGGALLGGIPGAILGALRKARGDEIALIPPLLAGFLTVVILTTGAIVALFVLGE